VTKLGSGCHRSSGLQEVHRIVDDAAIDQLQLERPLGVVRRLDAEVHHHVLEHRSSTAQLAPVGEVGANE